MQHPQQPQDTQYTHTRDNFITCHNNPVLWYMRNTSMFQFDTFIPKCDDPCINDINIIYDFKPLLNMNRKEREDKKLIIIGHCNKYKKFLESDEIKSFINNLSINDIRIDKHINKHFTNNHNQHKNSCKTNTKRASYFLTQNIEETIKNLIQLSKETYLATLENINILNNIQFYNIDNVNEYKWIFKKEKHDFSRQGQ